MKIQMKAEVDRIMRIVNDYRTGNGGLTESFVRKEIEEIINDSTVVSCTTCKFYDARYDYYCNKCLKFEKYEPK